MIINHAHRDQETLSGRRGESGIFAGNRGADRVGTEAVKSPSVDLLAPQSSHQYWETY